MAVHARLRRRREVEAVGPGVTSVRRGDRIAALTYYGKIFGGYAEVVCLPADYLIKVPDGVDPVAAVCLVLNYTTAFQMLKRTARVVAGEPLLVHGAAGGVGTAALELGRLCATHRHRPELVRGTEAPRADKVILFLL